MCAPCGESPIASAGAIHFREGCESCDGPLAHEHAHVVDLARRHLRCVCAECATRLPLVHPVRYRAIGNRLLTDPRLEMGAAEWAAIGVPLPLGYVMYDSGTERWVAHRPTPEGTREERIDPLRWLALAARTPLVAELRPDVEAILVGGRPRPQAWLAPIDACYELQGYVRRHWRGVHGASAWMVLDTFFDRLRVTSATLPARPAAGWQWLRRLAQRRRAELSAAV